MHEHTDTKAYIHTYLHAYNPRALLLTCIGNPLSRTIARITLAPKPRNSQQNTRQQLPTLPPFVEDGPYQDDVGTASIRFSPATFTASSRPYNNHSNSHSHGASLSTFTTPFKSMSGNGVTNSRANGGTRGRERDMSYDRRRAAANMSKVDYDVSMEAFGQELWALMCLNVDMLWETEQLTEKMIVMATR
jgi:hypothetical protein